MLTVIYDNSRCSNRLTAIINWCSTVLLLNLQFKELHILTKYAIKVWQFSVVLMLFVVSTKLSYTEPN